MTSVLLFILVIVNIMLGVAVIYAHCSKLLLSFGVSSLIHITEYMTMALFGAYFDFYSATAFMLISLAINVLCVVLFRKKIVSAIKSFKRPKLLPIPYIFALIIIMGSVYYMNGLFGMGQDQGVYQVKALALSEGEQHNSVVLENESELLKSTPYFDEDHEFAMYADNFFPSQLGFNENRDGSDVRYLSAVFHGTTAYPSLLALDVELFGVPGMMNINYLLVFISFVFLLEIVNLLDLNKFFGTLVLIIGLCSPTTIWTNKSALTESVQLPLLIAIVCGLLLATKTKKLGLVIVTVASIGFSSLHLCAFYILPIVGVMLLVNYIRTNNIFAIICNQIITVVYLLTFYIETKLYVLYVIGNITTSLNEMFGTSIQHGTYLKIIYCLTIVLDLITLVFVIPPVRKLGKKFLDSILYPVLMFLVMAACAGRFFMKLMPLKRELGLQNALNCLAMYGITLSSGIVMLPIVLIAAIVFMRKFLKDTKYEVVMISFVYIVLFLSTIIHPTIGHYYYYSRYFSPNVFCIPLVFAIVFDKMIKRKYLGYAGYFAGVASIIAILPFTIYVSSMRDDTHLTLKQFEEFTSNFKDGDAIVFSNSTRTKLMLPTKFTTDADVYDVPIIEPDLYAKYNNVYYVCWKDDIYTNGDFYKSVDIHNSSDPQYIHNYLFPLFDIRQWDYEIYIYKFDPSKYSSYYNVSELQLDGFSNPESGFVWSNSDVSNVSFYVTEIPENTYVHVNLASVNQAVIPKYILNDSSFRVLIDDEVVYEGTLKDIPYECIFSSDYLDENSTNIITFEFDTWVPAECIEGSTDTRHLGFAISGLSIK